MSGNATSAGPSTRKNGLIRLAPAMLFTALLSITGCSSMQGKGTPPPHIVAVCDLVGVMDSKIKGRITFTQFGATTSIVGVVEGLSPGSHGIHVHEHGACGNAGADAGGHYNPTDKKHGKAADMESHMGDLGNIVADRDGRAKISLDDDNITLDGVDTIVGRSLVVHQDPDDMMSQPAGNSGKRIACGAIVSVSK